MLHLGEQHVHGKFCGHRSHFKNSNFNEHMALCLYDFLKTLYVYH